MRLNIVAEHWSALPADTSLFLQECPGFQNRAEFI
jgi:hypothetical protein